MIEWNLISCCKMKGVWGVREGLKDFIFLGTCIKLGMCTIMPKSGGGGYLRMSQTCHPYPRQCMR